MCRSSMKSTSILSMPRSRSMSSFSWVSSSLPSRSTSPVFGSGTSCAETRPMTSSSAIGHLLDARRSIWRSDAPW